MAYCEIGQNLNVLKFYNNKKIFFEIGSSDSLNVSNTYLLEKIIIE